MSRKVLLTLIVCGMIVLIGQPKSLVAAGPSMAGSWQFTLTPITPVPSISIPGLATFTADGSLTETDGTEVVPGLGSSTNALTYGTPGHGIWQMGPCRCFFYVQYFSVVVNADSSLNATNVTTLSVTLASNGTQFGGSYTTVQEIGGSTKQIASGTISGTLIPHPKLP